MKKFFVTGIILIKKTAALIRAAIVKLQIFSEGSIKECEFESIPRSAPPGFDTDVQDPQV